MKVRVTAVNLGGSPAGMPGAPMNNPEEFATVSFSIVEEANSQFAPGMNNITLAVKNFNMFQFGKVYELEFNPLSE